MARSARRSARRATARAYADRATQRQVEVVAAYMACDSERAAASRLGLTVRTVERHLANARSRTGAPTTAHLVWILARRIEDIEAAPTPNARSRARSSEAASASPVESGLVRGGSR